MGHTQGKWRVEKNGAGVTYIRSSQKHGLGNDIYIATIHNSLDGCHNTELLKNSEANAHLIAASPKLLEALKLMVDLCEKSDNCHPYSETGQKYRIQAQQVINKAEGN